MGRTKKKVKEKKSSKEKRSYKAETNSRRYIYLLQYPLNELPKNKLPTIGNVLRYIQFLKCDRSVKFASTKDIIACPQGRGKALVCQEEKCKNPDRKCVVALVAEIWKSAGFGPFLLTGAIIRDKILKLHNKYAYLKQLWSLNWDSSKDKLSKLQEDFIEDSNKLFDIAVPNFEVSQRMTQMKEFVP